jgi:ABC-2 type transport system permease protein
MAIPDILQAFLDIGVLNGASPLNIVILVLLFIGGFIFYGFLGGVAGATVSKIEEMAEGMKLFTFTMLIGAYIPLFLIMGGTMGVGDMGVFTDVIMILPISSVFITPAYILLGKVSTGIAAVALLVMVVCIVILMFLVSSIFESLIYYNGNPLKFKDLTKIFKDKRRAK